MVSKCLAILISTHFQTDLKLWVNLSYQFALASWCKIWCLYRRTLRHLQSCFRSYKRSTKRFEVLPLNFRLLVRVCCRIRHSSSRGSFYRTSDNWYLLLLYHTWNSWIARLLSGVWACSLSWPTYLHESQNSCSNWSRCSLCEDKQSLDFYSQKVQQYLPLFSCKERKRR